MEQEIFAGVVGSNLYGCATADSDYDTFHVVMEDRDRMILHGWRDSTQIINENENTDRTTLGLGKFVSTLSKGTPNNIQLLWHPDPLVTTEPWLQILANRQWFVTVKALEALVGASKGAQRRFVEQSRDGAETSSKVLKHAATAFRWLTDAVSLDKKGFTEYPMPELVLDDYIAIRQGALNRDEILQMLAEADTKAIRALNNTTLPAHPPQDKVEALVVDLYWGAWTA